MAEREKGLPELQKLEDRVRGEIRLAYEEKLERLRAAYEEARQRVEAEFERIVKGFAERASP
ncbi:MAG: hypothetical protein LRS49_01930 [Desulfurococcales archaeon]|nr:hypothetical protein [Desulfurococcales archaeon]